VRACINLCVCVEGPFMPCLCVCVEGPFMPCLCVRVFVVGCVCWPLHGPNSRVCECLAAGGAHAVTNIVAAPLGVNVPFTGFPPPLPRASSGHGSDRGGQYSIRFRYAFIIVSSVDESAVAPRAGFCFSSRAKLNGECWRSIHTVAKI